MVNLFKRQGASIGDVRVQEKLKEADDIGEAVIAHLLNPFDCKSGIHDNCIGDCSGKNAPSPSAGLKRELQAMKSRMREKLEK